MPSTQYLLWETAISSSESIQERVQSRTKTYKLPMGFPFPGIWLLISNGFNYDLYNILMMSLSSGNETSESNNQTQRTSPFKPELFLFIHLCNN